MDPQQNKRMIFIVVGIVDAILSGIVLLIYFGALPLDISELGVPRWVIGLIGGVWFLGAIGFLAYQLSKTNISE